MGEFVYVAGRFDGDYEDEHEVIGVFASEAEAHAVVSALAATAAEEYRVWCRAQWLDAECRGHWPAVDSAPLGQRAVPIDRFVDEDSLRRAASTFYVRRYRLGSTGAPWDASWSPVTSAEGEEATK